MTECVKCCIIYAEFVTDAEKISTKMSNLLARLSAKYPPAFFSRLLRISYSLLLIGITLAEPCFGSQKSLMFTLTNLFLKSMSAHSRFINSPFLIPVRSNVRKIG
jgi:hypothetical protein